MPARKLTARDDYELRRDEIDRGREQLALDEGHRQEGDAVHLADVEDRAEVGVLEPRGGRGLEQWLVMGYAACFAVLGTNLSRRVLDRLSDKQFYYWTRRVILAIGAVYIAQGVWQVAR